MPLKIAIAIATAGRCEILKDTIGHLCLQSRLADELVICPAKAGDLDMSSLEQYPGKYQIYHGPVGLSSQRNVLLDKSEMDIIVFMDDDFLPSHDYLKEVEILFLSAIDVVLATGVVLADGITGPGLEHNEGLKILAEAGPNQGSERLEPVYNGYGCNMAFRVGLAKDNAIRFDERLPLYSWLEDVDFSRQLSSYGKIVKAPRLRGVHLGTKRAGRSPGKRLGYSQVVNPIYLARKGTMSWKRAINQVGRNLIANFVRSFAPEPWVDRRGRFSGNMRALIDLTLGTIKPENALNF